MGTWVLTMVIVLNGHLTSFSVGYDTKESCNFAKLVNREGLAQGSVILATCTMR